MHENDRGGQKAVNTIYKFKQETRKIRHYDLAQHKIALHKGEVNLEEM